MSERFPPLGLDNELTRELESDLEKHYGLAPDFKWKNDEGAPLGPFAVLAYVVKLRPYVRTSTDQAVRYTPELFHPWMGLGDAVLNQKDFGPRNREIACLAVIAIFNVPFIQYAHERIAVQVGLSQAQVSSAVKGTTPEGLTANEVSVYTTSLALARARGPLDKDSWQEAESKLGKEGAARLGHVVAWFIYNCTLLKLGAVDVPSG